MGTKLQECDRVQSFLFSPCFFTYLIELPPFPPIAFLYRSGHSASLFCTDLAYIVRLGFPTTDGTREKKENRPFRLTYDLLDCQSLQPHTKLESVYSHCEKRDPESPRMSHKLCSRHGATDEPMKKK